MENPTFSIDITDGGKKFFRNWIFKNLTFRIEAGNKLAVTGRNGSGKSTLLQVLCGYESLSLGNIRYTKNGSEIARENIFSHIDFHFQFKNLRQPLSTDDIIKLMELESSKMKTFKYFSSGMKQRTKLALAIISDVDLILLDEPLSNLDKQGEVWYRNLAEMYLADKTVVVCSNQNEAEYFFCEKTINISDYQ
ncbi:MAG: ATP-binding cassette domain-containing protein [Bacteroidetes bacterium]|nr:ATP-binding cassette domain-containing protein [Bacteroidota bacterium]